MPPTLKPKGNLGLDELPVIPAEVIDLIRGERLEDIVRYCSVCGTTCISQVYNHELGVILVCSCGYTFLNINSDPDIEKR